MKQFILLSFIVNSYYLWVSWTNKERTRFVIHLNDKEKYFHLLFLAAHGYLQQLEKQKQNINQINLKEVQIQIDLRR